VIRRILYVAAVALLFYALLPLAARKFATMRLASLVRRLKEGRTAGAFAGVCTGLSSAKIYYRPESRLTADEPPQELDTRRTRFLIMKPGTLPEEVSWKAVSLLKNGTFLYLLPPSAPRKKYLCVFHEEKKRTDVEALISSIETPRLVYPHCKPWCTAVGIFCCFTLFLSWLETGELTVSLLAALLGIIGKTLPWLPPGLALTLVSHRLDHKPHLDAKKNRQRSAAGFLLVSAGVLLNIAVVVLAFRSGISFR
jgi:hypothetical protein